MMLHLKWEYLAHATGDVVHSHGPAVVSVVSNRSCERRP